LKLYSVGLLKISVNKVTPNQENSIEFLLNHIQRLEGNPFDVVLYFKNTLPILGNQRILIDQALPNLIKSVTIYSGTVFGKTIAKLFIRMPKAEVPMRYCRSFNNR
jgi:hypothetical protein